MVKSLKVMLLPNNVQKTKMFQYAGAARFAYNWTLAREKENYENGGKFIPDSELRKEFTKLRNSGEYVWLQSVSNNVTKQAIKDACNTYKNFFKGLQKYPRYKSKKRSKPGFYQDNMNKTQEVKKIEKRKRRLQRSISRRYEKNKKGESYCKTSNIIKREKELLKLNHRLTNIYQKQYNNRNLENLDDRLSINWHGIIYP